MAGDLGIIVAGAIGAWGSPAGRKAQRSFGVDGTLPIVANITIEEHHHDELEITEHPVERGSTISDHAFMRPFEVTILCAWSSSTIPPKTLLGGISGALTNKLTGTIQNQITGHASQQIGGSALGNLAVASLGTLIANPLISFGAQINDGTGKGSTSLWDIYQSLQDLQRSAKPLTVYTGKRKYESMLIKSMTVETDIKTENSLVVRLTMRQVILVSVTVVSVTAPPASQADASRTNPVENDGSKQLIEADANINLQLGRTITAIYPGQGRTQ